MALVGRIGPPLRARAVGAGAGVLGRGPAFADPALHRVGRPGDLPALLLRLAIPLATISAAVSRPPRPNASPTPSARAPTHLPRVPLYDDFWTWCSWGDDLLRLHLEFTSKDEAVLAKFDSYSFSPHKEAVIDLLSRVITVSVETVTIVRFDGRACTWRLTVAIALELASAGGIRIVVIP